MSIINLSGDNSSVLLLIVFLWTIPWKLYSLWLASKNNHKGWFVFLVIFNTVGILEIIYIFGVAKKKWPEVQKAFLRAISFKK